MSRLILTIVGLTALASLTACQGAAYKMAAVKFDPQKYSVVGEGEQSVTGLMVVGIIPIQNTNKVQRAVDAILDSHGGDELVNITVQESYFWAVVLNGFRVDVSGTVLKKRK